MPRIKISKEDEELLVKMYLNGSTYKELTEYFHCSKTPIERILKEHGVKLNHRRVERQLNEHYFSVIDSPIKAYFIGFIFADGGITKNHDGTGQYQLSITLLKEDKNILELLKKELNSRTEIRPNRDRYIRYWVRSDIIVKDLAKYNIIPNKTYEVKGLPKNIPSEFLADFMRGYIDSDGSVWIEKMNNNNLFHVDITTHYKETAEDARDLIYQLINKPYRIQERIVTRHNGSYHFALNGIEAYQLATVLYENAPIYCNRKYRKYMLSKKKYDPEHYDPRFENEIIGVPAQKGENNE